MNRVLALALFVAGVLLSSAAHAAPPLLPEKALPTDEGGLPGEGALRRYDSYVARWQEFRSRWAAEAKQDQGAVVFLGDSITQGWGPDFKGQFAGMKLANRGIGGDTTRGMLIRLDEDVLSLNPAAIVMLLGTNDIEVGIEPEAIGRNFQKILAAIKAKHPHTPIVLCRMFPSSAAKSRPAETIRRVNELYDAAVKGDPQVVVVDTWALFADAATGDANPAWFKDLLHLNPAGYDRWAAALRPVLATLGFLDTEPDDFAPEPGFTSLFNGRDLTGWGVRPTPPRKAPKNPKTDAPAFVEVKEAATFDGLASSPDGRYRAINGRLVVTTPPEGRRIQQLWTTQDFGSDFVLKLEFRATPNADSGVFLRQPQLQCRDFLLAGPYTELKQFKQGDWNELVVTVKGDTAHATCNGELLTADMKLPASGPIGLEGDRGQMEYRRIRIQTAAAQERAPKEDTQAEPRKHRRQTSAAAAADQAANLARAFSDFVHTPDVVYKQVGEVKLMLDILTPKDLTSEAAPLLVYIHGGGWGGGDRYKVTRPDIAGVIRRCGAAGIVCATIEYRLNNERATAFDSAVDCKDALRFLVKNAAKYRIDPERIATIGGSAGGHLSLVTALGDPKDFPGDKELAGYDPKLCAEVSYYPATDFTDRALAERFLGPRAKLMFGGTPEEKADVVRLLSPVVAIRQDSTPVYLFHGDLDKTLPVENSRKLYAKGKEIGADIQYTEVKNGPHGFGRESTPDVEEICDLAAKFIIERVTR